MSKVDKLVQAKDKATIPKPANQPASLTRF
jgi:hypothetical protein